MLSILSPGQGAQKPGLFKTWLENENTKIETTHLLEQWSTFAEIDLIKLGTTATEEEILDTKNTQPLLVATSLLGFHFLEKHLPIPEDTIIAGHSIGELAVAGIANIITAAEAVKLATVRGKAMSIACQESKTGMVALLGGEKEEVLKLLKDYDLYPANFNAKGQIVAAGKASDLNDLADNPPNNIRVRKLAVAGAFHSPYMQKAQDAFVQALAGLKIANPRFPILTNKDGSIVTSGKTMLENIATQITSPVNWTACLDTLKTRQVTKIIELPPAGVLTNIAKRELPETNKTPINTPTDLFALTL